MTPVDILTTGGTVENAYSEHGGSVMNVDNKIQRSLHRSRLPDPNVFVAPLLNRDSLEMTDANRTLALRTVRGLLRENPPINITHGNDTIIATGLYLRREIPNLRIPVVLTGAMTPLGFAKSGGLQNLTASLFASRLLPLGIRVVMHNRGYPVDRIRKDHERSRFVWYDPGTESEFVQ